MKKNYNDCMSFGEDKFIHQTFDYSTADVEASIFFGDSSGSEVSFVEEDFSRYSGVYQLIDDQLYEVVNFPPPSSQPLLKSSGLFKLSGF